MSYDIGKGRREKEDGMGGGEVAGHPSLTQLSMTWLVGYSARAEGKRSSFR